MHSIITDLLLEGNLVEMGLFASLKNKGEPMNPIEKSSITVQVIVHSSLEKVWRIWISPIDIMNWNAASEEWHTTKAENDLRTGGRFSYRMEAKDGSMGFDFGGIYSEVILQQRISYILGDERIVSIDFSSIDDKTMIVETFEPETTNSLELQRDGWQAILNRFKNYAEKNN
jgi:uncharacterized protein YndB with AHSA1/START domain